MYFGPNMYDSQPTVSGAEIILNASGRYGLAQFPSPIALTAFTSIGLGRKKAAAGSQLQGMMSKVQQYLDFTPAWASSGEFPGVQFGNASASFASQQTGLWQQYVDQWNIIANRYDGTRFDVFAEEARFQTSTNQTSLSTSVQDLWFGVLLNSTIFSKYTFSYLALWPRALTDAEVRTAVSVLRSYAATNSITSVGNPRFVLAEGDSITANTGGTSYEFQGGPSLSPRANGASNAVAGASLNIGTNSLTNRLSAALQVVPPSGGKNGRMYVYTMLIGRNDGASWGTPAAYAAAIASHVANVKAGGYDRVVLCTLLPSTVAGFNAWRNSVNAIITGSGWAAANGVDAIADFAAEATMGPDAAASNTTYYPDGTHPSTAGYALLAPVWAAAVNSLT